jgi:hypothetical protein
MRERRNNSISGYKVALNDGRLAISKGQPIVVQNIPFQLKNNNHQNEKVNN